MLALLFILFAGLAIGCAIAVVVQRNPLYSAISLIGVFIALACLYLLLAAPFIAAVQIIVYGGAIMVLVVFVIMLLNVEEEVRRPTRLVFLVPTAFGLAVVLIAQVAFILYSVHGSPLTPREVVSDTGLSASIGIGLFTKYLLPFEITSILLIMAVVGAITLARRSFLVSREEQTPTGARILAMPTSPATKAADRSERADEPPGGPGAIG
ncbi:MAG TPA: NADH-quinone oxidoreductase subunit J [Pyrinomonadaceae bacterium]|nr:NADH-quinone oxidoreductase subunit J [Pyrinomonadaceae bacterium]